MNNSQPEQKKQNLVLRNQTELELTGIIKLLSMNNNEFIVQTNFGDVFIKGDNLEMKQLDTEKGIIWINGKIIGFEYLDVKKPKEQSFLKKLFR